MRVLGVDWGRRRIGLAVSDATGLLARPLRTLVVTGDAGIDEVVDEIVQEIERLAADPDGLGAIVVGVPRRLDGSESSGTLAARAFIDRLRPRTPLPIVAQDERLTSHEAESLLATRERDWRKRKQQLDAAAAAVILQDYLDQHRP